MVAQVSLKRSDLVFKKPFEVRRKGIKVCMLSKFNSKCVFLIEKYHVCFYLKLTCILREHH